MTQLSIALVLLGMMGLVGFLAKLRWESEMRAAGRADQAVAMAKAVDAAVHDRCDNIEARLSKLEDLRPFIDDMKLKMSLEGR